MRVLVVDDLLMAETEVARALENDGDVEVVGVRNPTELSALLARDGDFQLALVDLHYGREARESGLAAFTALSEHSIPSVVHSVDEDNRMLFLLAVFRFFPETWTVVPKSAGRAPLRRAVEAARAGHRADDAAARPYKRAAPLLDQLLRRPTDLIIWRAMLHHFREPQVARSANVSKRVVSQFTADRRPVVARIEAELLGRRTHPYPPVEADERNTNLLEVSAFARLNADFFTDPTVDRLVSGAVSRR
jgi:DNA-binding NarL/FixJ family response regulator